MLDDPPRAPQQRAKFPLPTVLIGIAVVAVVMGGTVLALGYRSGRFDAADSTEFTPSDGSFTVVFDSFPGGAFVLEGELKLGTTPMQLSLRKPCSHGIIWSTVGIRTQRPR